MKTYEIGDTIELFNGDKPKISAKIIGTSTSNNGCYLVSDFNRHNFYDRLENGIMILKPKLINIWLISDDGDDEFVGNIEDYYNKFVAWVYNSHGYFITL